MTRPFADRLARHVAHAAGRFEHLLLGRSPTSVSVVGCGDWMVVQLHEPFSAVERRLAADEAGAERVRAYHRSLFDHALESLVDHVREATGVELRGAIVHVETETGSILKTFTTHPDVDLFLFGRGVPALGVPVDAHLHATGTNGTYAAGGIGAVRS